MTPSKNSRYWACPLAVPMPFNVKGTNKVQKTGTGCCPSLPSFLRAATAQAALGHCCPTSAPAAAVCNAAPKKCLCFVSWTDGPSCVKRQHHDFMMCPFLFNLVPIMQKARHVWCHLTLRPMQYMFAEMRWDWAPSHLPSTYLTAIALCSLFLPLPIWIFCYQSPAADIFLIIPSLQSIFCKQLVNSLWDLESLC